jgi:ATP-dependent Lon protease
VLFPNFVAPITVGREKSNAAIRAAFAENKYIAVFGQVDADDDDPIQEDLFKVGTLARIVKMFSTPDGNTTAVLQGRKRVRIKKLIQEDPFLRATVLK